MIKSACKVLFIVCIFSVEIFSQSKTIHKQFSTGVNSKFASRGVNIPYTTSRKTIINSLSSVASTVVFEESFDGPNFPPTGWITVNADGGGSTGPWFQGNTSIFTPYSGSGYAAANYQGANDFYIDEWLISPQIMSVGTDDTLSFWNRSPDGSSWDDSIEVRISTTDSATSSFIIKLSYFKTSTNGWEQKKFPLKNYVSIGSNIRVAFRYLLYNAGLSGISSDYVGIDLVQILRPQVAKDIKVASIDYPYSASKILLGETIEPSATFQNSGSSPQSNIQVKLRIISPTGTIFEDTKSIASLTPDQTTQVIFGNYSPSTAGTYSVRAYSILADDQNTTNDSLTSSFTGAILLSGTYTVGTGGDIPTLKDAIDSLNHNVIADEITFSLISSSYNEPPLSIGPPDYSFTTNPVILKPAPSVSPIINIISTSSENFGLRIYGVSKITVDGSNSNQDTRNLTINANGSYGKIGVEIIGTDGEYADSNCVKNLIVQTGADSLSSSDEYYGILLYGFGESYKSIANKVSNCEVTRHGGAGIATQWQNNVVVENNFIHDWTQIIGSNDVHGIWLADGTTNGIVSGNTIGNIKTLVNYFWAYGIENSSGTGSNIMIYNNMIYNILSSGSGTNMNFSCGICGSNTSNSNDGYYYNSIYLDGVDLSTSGTSRTSGLEFAGGSNITVKNNIVYNQSILTGLDDGNKAYCIYLSALPTNFASNNNCWFASGLQGVIGYNSGNKILLSDWENSFSPVQDNSSISADPLFISAIAGNLHIQTNITSPVNAAGTPISGITLDIDKNVRNTITPDIGADEFMPGAFTVSTMYNEGWNLISVPLTVDDYYKTSIYPSAVSVAFSYKSSYQADSILTNGIGYWMKFGSQQNIELAGSPLLLDTVNVLKGWNIIGSLTNPILTSSIEQIPASIVNSKYYSYEGYYTEADTLKSGKGYWVKVSQDGKLILQSR